MNWLGLIAVLLAYPAFVFGCWSARRKLTAQLSLFGWGMGVVLAIPATLYFTYYTKLFGEQIWFYQLRTLPGSELLAALAGFLAGWVHIRVIPRLRLSKQGTHLMIPALLGFVVAVPYLKPFLRPQQIHFVRAQWRDGVCLQSTASTCGPAAAATILNHLGITTSERELAVAAFTSASGTENWYLARALRRYGVQTSFAFSKDLNAVFPAIVGVRLKESANSGHFIALFGRQSNKFIFGDPMEGRFTNSIAEVADKYEFTGFMLSIQSITQPSHDH
jgi:hypothetical protein